MQALQLLSDHFAGHRQNNWQTTVSPCQETLKTRMDTLAGLPTELLMTIIEYLDIIDLACLSACNRRLLGISQWGLSRLNCNNDEKFSILTRLERDMPQYFACHHCYLLHKYDGSKSFKKNCKRIPCRNRHSTLENLFRSHNNRIYIWNHISFLQVKLCMKSFVHGSQYGIDTESLNCLQVCNYPPDSIHSGMTLLHSREAQISSHCLELGVCLRMQDVVLVDVSSDLIPSPKDLEIIIHYELEMADFHDNPSRFLEVCRHVSFIKLKPAIIELLGAKPGGRHYISYKCKVCNTESHLEIKRFNSKTALIMTKWVGLGHGIYDNDPLWRNHAFWNEEDVAKIDSDLLSPRISFEKMVLESEETNTDDLPSPRMCFEEMASESFESLMFRNLSCLRNEKYRKDLCFSQWRVGKCEVSLLRYKEPPNAATRTWNCLTDWISVYQHQRPVGQVLWPGYG